MKKLNVLAVFIILTVNLIAQESNDLYLESFKLHLAYLDSLNKGKNTDTYFVELDFKVANNLPGTINGIAIEYLDKETIKKKGRQSLFHLIVIKELELKADKIEINIIDFFIEYKKRILGYTNSGGSKLIYKYDCDKSQYILHEKRQGGI